MQWDNGPTAGFSEAGIDRLYAPIISDANFSPSQVNVIDQIADPESLLSKIKMMVQVRKSHPAFGWGDFHWAEKTSTDNTGAIAAYWRVHQAEKLLILQNLSPLPQSVEISLPPDSIQNFRNLLPDNSTFVPDQGRFSTTLNPFEFLWLQGIP
jgi:maltose alpha-D-glucosyltransferase/alpha-amylase